MSLKAIGERIEETLDRVRLETKLSRLYTELDAIQAQNRSRKIGTTRLWTLE